MSRLFLSYFCLIYCIYDIHRVPSYWASVIFCDISTKKMSTKTHLGSINLVQMQTLKHNTKVFTEHFLDVCKSLKNVLFWLGCYYNLNELQWLLRNYCTNVRKSGETSRQMLSDIYLRHNCLISCSKFLIFLLYLWCA